MAVPIVLAALVIIAALVAGAFASSIQEYRIGRAAVSQERALSAAEYGQNMLLSEWSPMLHAKLKTGDVLLKEYRLAYGGKANVEITKINTSTYWVVSEGVSGAGVQTEARRRTGMIIRLEIPDIKALGAFTSRGRTVVRGSVIVNGNDSIPSGWSDCPEDRTNKPGIVNKDPLDRDACATCVFGSPPVADDNRAGDTATYFNYGISNYQTIAGQADKVYNVGSGSLVVNGIAPALTAGGDCDFGALNNWGDVGRAATPGVCEPYFPIIHAVGPGTFKITTGKGQGALFVDGDLELAGNVQFNGLVIVRGSLKMTGTGNKIMGAVMAAQIEADDSALLAGNSSVQYSSCAVATSMATVARLDLAARRSWADMY